MSLLRAAGLKVTKVMNAQAMFRAWGEAAGRGLSEGVAVSTPFESGTLDGVPYSAFTEDEISQRIVEAADQFVGRLFPDSWIGGDQPRSGRAEEGFRTLCNLVEIRRIIRGE